MGPGVVLRAAMPDRVEVPNLEDGALGLLDRGCAPTDDMLLP